MTAIDPTCPHETASERAAALLASLSALRAQAAAKDGSLPIPNSKPAAAVPDAVAPHFKGHDMYGFLSRYEAFANSLGWSGEQKLANIRFYCPQIEEAQSEDEPLPKDDWEKLRLALIDWYSAHLPESERTPVTIIEPVESEYVDDMPTEEGENKEAEELVKYRVSDVKAFAKQRRRIRCWEDFERYWRTFFTMAWTLEPGETINEEDLNNIFYRGISSRVRHGVRKTWRRQRKARCAHATLSSEFDSLHKQGETTTSSVPADHSHPHDPRESRRLRRRHRHIRHRGPPSMETIVEIAAGLLELSGQAGGPFEGDWPKRVEKPQAPTAADDLDSDASSSISSDSSDSDRITFKDLVMIGKDAFTAFFSKDR